MVVVDNVNDADFDPTNELQDLGIVGDSITINGGTSIFLGDVTNVNNLGDTAFVLNGDTINLGTGTNTDNQQITILGDTLFLEEGGSIFLGDITNVTNLGDTAFLLNGDTINFPTDLDTDPSNELQDLGIVGDSITISGGTSIFLGDVTNVTNLGDSAFVLNGDTINLGTGTNTDNQQITILGDTLLLEDGGFILLGDITNTTQLSDSSFVINGDTITFPSDADSDPTNELQDLVVVGDSLIINGGTNVYLGDLINVANVGDSSIVINGDTIYTINFGTDAQNLTGATLTGNTLQIDIENGNSVSVNLGSLAAGLDSIYGQGDSLILVSNGGTNTAFVDLGGFADTDDQTLAFIGNQLTIADGNTVTLTDVDPLNELQNLSFDTDSIYISNGSAISIIDVAINGPAGTNGTNGATGVAGPMGATGAAGSPASDDQFIDQLSISGNNLLISLDNDGIAPVSVDLSPFANDWHLTGNSGTNPATNFLGTTDNQALSFRLNNSWAGRWDHQANNYFIGANSGENTSPGADLSGQQNIGLGSGSLMDNTTGAKNVALGINSLNSNTSGSANVGVGSSTLRDNTTGFSNVAIGSGPLTSNTTGYRNVAIGENALLFNTSGLYNVAMGFSTLRYNTIGEYNIALGSEALESNTTGDDNIAVGEESLTANTSGSSNIGIGRWSLRANTVGVNNQAIGNQSLRVNTTGTWNTAIGLSAQFDNVSGSNNGSIGNLSHGNNAIGNNNVSLGVRAGNRDISGNDNVYLGFEAGGMNSIPATFTRSRNVFIGYQAGRNEAGSNRLYIESTSSTTPLIYGEFDNNVVKVNGDLGVGAVVGTPSNTLHVNNGAIDPVRIENLATDATLNNIMVTDALGVVHVRDASSLGGVDKQNTLDEAYDEGGPGIGRTILATNGAVRLQGTDGLLVTGTFGSGALIEIGAGPRMFFNPRTGSFRAGNSFGLTWTNANAGTYSTEFGSNTTASGAYSFASGHSTISSGLYSFAMGINSDATGTASTAFGQGSIASGNYSFAIGNNSDATAPASAAFGQSNLASGDFSFVTGNNSNATNDYSFTPGNNANATGLGAVAFGLNTSVASTNSVAFGSTNTITTAAPYAFVTGLQNTVTDDYSAAIGFSHGVAGRSSFVAGEDHTVTFAGDYAAALGLRNTVSDLYTFSAGSDNVSSDNGAVTLGQLNTTSHTGAMAFGTNNFANDDESMAFGRDNYSDGLQSVAMGYESRARGNYSFAIGRLSFENVGESMAIGRGLIAKEGGELVFGRWNDTLTNAQVTGNGDNRLFVVGNGTDNLNRNSTFEIHQSGLAQFGGDMQWRDGNTSGLPIADLFDDGNDGRFRILENGATQIDLDANTGSVFNEQGFDRDFRIETNINPNAIFVNAGANRIGMGTGAPSGFLHISQNNSGTNPTIELTETQLNDGARIEFNNSIETNNNWSLWGRADNTATDNEFNIYHTAYGNILRLRYGSVGIKRAPATSDLEVNGTASKSVTGAWLANSDSRLKRDINTISGATALDKIKQMRGVTYFWDDDTTGYDRPTFIQMGFVAQELQKIYPEKVTEDHLGYLQTGYGDYDAIFVEAIKELSNQIDELKDNNPAITIQNSPSNMEQSIETTLAGIQEDNDALKEKNDLLKEENELIKAKLIELEEMLKKLILSTEE